MFNPFAPLNTTCPSLFGLEVHVAPDLPRMRLSEDCPCTPEYRAELNAWMLEFFGTTNPLDDGQVLDVTWPTRRLVMNLRTLAKLQAAARLEAAMTDKRKREMLEAAALAAGLNHLIWTPGSSPLVPLEHRAVPDRCCWNPLADDGDCARLEAALGIDVEWWKVGVISRKLRGLPHSDIVVRMLFDDRGGDRNAARRAASVAVAAEIGRQMQSAEGAD